jgi:FixJ family two-component response regulator
MTECPAIYIVDDDAPARKAVATLIEAMGVPTFSYESAEGFLKSYDGRRPACLITDIRMPGMSGLDLQDELARRGTVLPIIVLTGYASTPSTVRAMRNGALTLLEKPCRDDELWDAIREGLAADRKAIALARSRVEIRERFERLSAKERDVLAHICAGDANKVVARKLSVSLRTVELHRQSVFFKMDANSLAELVRMVVLLEGEGIAAS